MQLIGAFVARIRKLFAYANSRFSHGASQLVFFSRSVQRTIDFDASRIQTFILTLFVVTAAGGVLCGSPKKQPRISPIVQFIFFFWSFEITGNILRNQKI